MQWTLTVLHSSQPTEGQGSGVCTAKNIKNMPRVNSDFNFDDACALRMKGAKDLFIVIDISRDIIVNVEEIDKTLEEEEEQEVPERESAVNVRIKCLLAL